MALTPDQAVANLDFDNIPRNDFDIVLSHLGRAQSPTPEDPSTFPGYVLLRKLTAKRSSHLLPPVILFTSMTNEKYKETSKSLGAYEQTSDPFELLQLIIVVLQDAQYAR